MVAEQIFSDDLILLELIFRVLLALVIGFAIGFERKMRFKEAGVRTHTIVCIAAVLYTMISVYGFSGGDPARVAAQVVPGIGFIGAGMIFYHKETIRGLTTAAGIWATAAIGMAVGVGWYTLSVVAALSIILIQCVMHMNFRIFHSHHYVKVNIIFTDATGEVAETIKNLFSVDRFSKISAQKDGDSVIYTAVISTDKILSVSEIHKVLTENKSIRSITRQDDVL